VGRGTAVEATRVARADDLAELDQSDDLRANAHAASCALGDVASDERLAREGRADGGERGAATVALRRNGQVARLAAARHEAATLPSGDVTEDGVATPVPDGHPEDNDGLLVRGGSRSGLQTGLARLGGADAGCHEASRHLAGSRVGRPDETGVRRLAGHGRPARGAGRRPRRGRLDGPDAVAALVGAVASERRVEHRHDTALAPTPFLADDDGRDGDPGALEREEVYRGTFLDPAARDGEDAVGGGSVGLGAEDGTGGRSAGGHVGVPSDFPMRSGAFPSILASVAVIYSRWDGAGRQD
jgi:hypothetical protein